jgi:hypothetical protein
MNFNQIDEACLNNLCDLLAKSQMTLMQDKTEDPEKQSDITKQLTAINSVLTSAMRLRNVLRKIKK